MSTYAVIVERAEDGGYGTWCPDLPGCVALGETPEEAVTQMAEAIRFHLDGMRADGEPIPVPSTVKVATIEAA